MWHVQSQKDKADATQREQGPINPWHNADVAHQAEHPSPEDPARGASHLGTTAVNSPTSDLSTGSDTPSSPEEREGTWGERDAGETSQRMAMEDYEALRRDLTALSKTRSKEETPSLFRTVTGRSIRRTASKRTQTTHSVAGDDETDIEAGEGEKEEEFELDRFMREGHFEKRVEGQSAKKVGVVWKNLNVKGTGSTATFVKTLPQAVMGTFGPDLYHILTSFFPRLKFGKKPPTRTLINDFSGLVKDGEMLLVLGKPGSGCSTFLKAIANSRETFAEVTGDVSYGGIPADKQKKRFRGEVNYNPEDDVHFASLNVWQTFVFALLCKTKKKEKHEIPIIVNALLKMFGISHTKYTLVGDEYIRGISGGERKRVSIAETLASKSTVVCWDNSTRGLDASTALDYARSLRIMTDISNRTTFVTLYQAGEGIYEVMDKVMVIDQGRCAYFGPASEAKAYFENLGFQCPERQTTADFLTAVTDPNERQFREGYEQSAPKNGADFERIYRSSEIYQRVQEEIEVYEKELAQSAYLDAKNFEEAVKESKSKRVPNKSPYTVSFPRQVLACTEREFWLIFGDRTTLNTKVFIIISMALVVGSIFYGESLDTAGAFPRGGALFFSTLFLGWLQMTELMKAVSGRSVIARHKDYAFYRPSAVALARVLTDIPVIFAMVCIFGLVMYFMCNLDLDPSKFFIYLLLMYTTTMCVTAFYRMFAALSPTIDDAVRFCGIGLNLLVIYTGYVIPKPQLINEYIWFGWIYYINPVGYSFEAMLGNEFGDRVMQCSPQNLVPQGPGIDPTYQGCAFSGAQIDAKSVTGRDYLATTYQYDRANLWRNFGILIAFTIGYILVTLWATETFQFTRAGGEALIFKKTKKAKQELKQEPVDEEKAIPESGATTNQADPESQEKALNNLERSDSVFTWRDVEYSVPYQGGQKKLLNKVSGYAKPGLMVALMGASGAGKTTLLNTISQRQTVGVVSGDMLVDGKPLGMEFQRGTGFCEQMDLHDGTATIREALEFSAILRQDRNIPREEKIEYVDQIIDLLELTELQDAIISSLGVEQRKRLTIGVELAAKPSLLLFLDEPTSGLDSQSAYSVIRFLKKLAAAGQAIVCTIHQPSSILIQQFDMILALNPGGNTFYFGPVGENGSAVIQYFADRGVHCPPHKNVAEFILETAAKGGKRKDGKRLNWNEEWKNSEQNKEMLAEIERINNERRSQPSTKDGKQEYEFAAPVWLQTTELTKRLFKQYWRDPSYLYGKLFVSVTIGIFNGFTFWMLGNSIQDMQDRMFTLFTIFTIPPTIVNAVVPKFYQNMALWKARELPSRIYGWFAFVTAQVVAEIPITIVCSILYFVLWYFPTGLPVEAPIAGYVFLMTLLIFLFQASWGQWICAFAPSFTVISNILPFFFTVFALFNGIVRPYSEIPSFWRYWMYWLNPSTYWIGGVLAAALPGTAVRCTPSETGHFNPPPGQTCIQYAGNFVQSTTGYLLNPDAREDCQFCPYSDGADYLSTLNIVPGNKWPYFAIFLAFVISNWALVYFFIWTVRIKGWTFGFGPLTKWIGKGMEVVEKPIKRWSATRRAKKEEAGDL